MIEYRPAVDHDRPIAGSFAVHERPGAVDREQGILVLGRGGGARAETGPRCCVVVKPPNPLAITAPSPRPPAQTPRTGSAPG